MTRTHRGAAAGEFGVDEQANVDAIIEHFNANHADTVLLLARGSLGRTGAFAAEAMGVDARGVDIAVTTAGGTEMVRLRFDSVVTTAAAVQTAMLDEITSSRAAVGEAVPETSMERELRVTPSLPTFITAVAEVVDLTPNIREVSFRGGLDDFRPLGGDHFAYLMVPTPPMRGRFPPGFSMSDYRTLTEDERPNGAN
jgi:hypothetical protein